MTDDKMRAQARAIAQRRGIGRLANDTKWREFFARILVPAFLLEIKLINDDEIFACRLFAPVPGYVEGGSMGPVIYALIEYIRSDQNDRLSAEALAVGLEFEVRDGLVTVFGYR